MARKQPDKDKVQVERQVVVDRVKPRYISITDFCLMVGRKSRQWYYAHQGVKGMPKRYYGPGNVGVLRYDDCVAFAERAFKREPQRAAGDEGPGAP